MADLITSTAADGQKTVELTAKHKVEGMRLDQYLVGMFVHPAKGHWSGTLANALQYHFAQLSQLNGDYRPGIVHRLDRDTSGVILVAKEETTHRELSAQFENRKIFKEYIAITQ